MTLCVERRACLLGAVRGDVATLSSAGAMVERVWAGLGRLYPGVTMDAFVVMPNHLHGIVILGDPRIRSMYGGGVGLAGADRDGATVPTRDVDGGHGVGGERRVDGVHRVGGEHRVDVVGGADGVRGSHRERGNGAPPDAGISLSTLIQRFKTFTAHEYGKGVALEGWPRYPGRLWQHRFYEHVIRNQRDLDAIREYIVDNPKQWTLDRENPDRTPAH